MESCSEVIRYNNVFNKINPIEVFENIDVSEVSKKDYQYRIKNFIEFIKNNPFQRNSFLMYKKHLGDRVDIKISTKNKYIAAARIFLKELNRMGILNVDITINVRCFKTENKHKVQGLDQNEINLVVEKLNHLDNSIRNVRLKAIIAFLIFQGLRKIEVLRLELEDVDLIKGTCFIHGKGRDDKELIFLHPEVIKIVRDYIEKSKIKSGYLFQSLSNNRSNGMISSMSVHREIKSIFNQLGINKSVHCFRHYYVTSLLKNLKDVNTVRKFTRHKNLEQLIIYDDEIDIENKAVQVFDCFKNISLN